jgi:hypothetical protein
MNRLKLTTTANIIILTIISIYAYYDKTYALLIIPAATTLAALIAYKIIKHRRHQKENFAVEEYMAIDQPPPTQYAITPPQPIPTQNMPHGNNAKTDTPQKTFEEKITQKINQLLDTADEEIQISIDVPIDQTITVNGKETQLKGKYTIKIDNTTKPQQPTQATPTQPTTPATPTITERPVSE